MVYATGCLGDVGIQQLRMCFLKTMHKPKVENKYSNNFDFHMIICDAYISTLFMGHLLKKNEIGIEIKSDKN